MKPLSLQEQCLCQSRRQYLDMLSTQYLKLITPKVQSQLWF